MLLTIVIRAVLLLQQPPQPSAAPINLSGAIGGKISALTAGIAGLGLVIASLSFTVILVSWMSSPMAREWAQDNKQQAAGVLFATVLLPLVPAIITAVGA